MRVGFAFLRLAAVVLVAIGLSPALAHAATLTTVPDANDDALTLQALPGETNDISIQADSTTIPWSGFNVVITDSGAPLTIGSGDGCSLVDAHTANCHMDVGTVRAGDGNDRIVLGLNAPPVFVEGGPGNDEITGSYHVWNGMVGPEPVPVLDGGPGNDTLALTDWAENVVLRGGDGNDSITFGPWYLEGSDVTVDGGPGDDSITARDDRRNTELQQPSSIRGGDGNDTIDVAGLDGTVISGGGGDDTIRSYDSRVTLNGDEGNDHISAGDRSTPPGWSPAAVIADGGPGDDTVVGSDGNDVVRGGDGSDVLSGIGGDDQLDGGAGDDRIDGGDGWDVVGGGDGNDVLLGGNGNDVLLDGPGEDLLSGGAGSDRIDYSARATPITVVDTGAHPAHTTGEVDHVAGDIESIVLGAGNDTYYGAGTPSDVQGGPGDDTLIGGPAADHFAGGPGQDTIYGGDGADLIDGGAGDDVLSGDGGDDTIDAADFGGINFSPLIPLGRGDQVSCGGGSDAVVADYYDAVAFDGCEAVRDGAADWRTTRAARRTVVLKARCAWLIDRACRGKARLSWSNDVPVPRSALARTQGGTHGPPRGCAAARRARVVGSGAFSLAPGRVNRVTLRLTARGRRLLAHRHCLLARATFSFSAPGPRIRTMTRTLALRPARR